jgi:hypothetical protein
VRRFTCVIIIGVLRVLVPEARPGHGVPGEAIVFAIESIDDSTFGGGHVPPVGATPVIDKVPEALEVP